MGFFRLIRFKNLVILSLTQLLSVFYLTSTKHKEAFILSSLLLFSCFLVAAAGYIINDYFDVKIDLINKPGKVVVGKQMSRRKVLLSHLTFSVLGVAIGFYLSVWLGVLLFFTTNILWIYSKYLKCTPLLGNITVALVATLSFVTVIIIFPNYSKEVYFFISFAFLSTLIRELVKDIEDLKGDLQFGCKTYPGRFGIRKTKVLIFIVTHFFLISIVVFGAFLYDWKIAVSLFLISTLTIYFLYCLYWADTKKEYKKLSGFLKIIMLFGIGLIPFV